MALDIAGAAQPVASLDWRWLALVALLVFGALTFKEQYRLNRALDVQERTRGTIRALTPFVRRKRRRRAPNKGLTLCQTQAAAANFETRVRPFGRGARDQRGRARRITGDWSPSSLALGLSRQTPNHNLR